MEMDLLKIRGDISADIESVRIRNCTGKWEDPDYSASPHFRKEIAVAGAFELLDEFNNTSRLGASRFTEEQLLHEFRYRISEVMLSASMASPKAMYTLWEERGPRGSVLAEIARRGGHLLPPENLAATLIRPLLSVKSVGDDARTVLVVADEELESMRDFLCDFVGTIEMIQAKRREAQLNPHAVRG